MRYLCRLITPPGGIVLDPFCGSGSTLKAAVLEGFSCIGIDSDAEYYAIAEARVQWALAQRRGQQSRLPGFHSTDDDTIFWRDTGPTGGDCGMRVPPAAED